MMTLLAFLACGGVSGILIAYAMDLRSPRELAQGAVGGLIVGLLMAFLLPR